MERLAKAVLLAAKLREESYDMATYVEEFENTPMHLKKFIDPSKFYKLTMWDASDQAAMKMGFDKRGTRPVYLLLMNSWNEALDWAEKFSVEGE